MASHSLSATFDPNGDARVDTDDLSRWLVKAGPVRQLSHDPYGATDMNLEGADGGLDFSLWNSHKFTVSSIFCNGDLYAEDFVDAANFGTWNREIFTS